MHCSKQIKVCTIIIVIEGIDGSGKDTQFELLEKEKKFSYFKYPTSANKKIKEYLERKREVNGSELVDLFLDDIYSEQEKIAKMSQKGLVITDRYVFSTIAYEAHLLDSDEIKKRIELHGFIKPDLVILLDLPASISYERKKKQKVLDRYEENVLYLENVRQNFLDLYENQYYAKKWVKIDASKSIRDVHTDILNVL